MTIGISVIIRSYNSRGRILALLKSLATQRVQQHVNWEIVLVDNNSSDDTIEISKKIWKDLSKSITPKIEMRVRDCYFKGQVFCWLAGVQHSNHHLLLLLNDRHRLNVDYLQQSYDSFHNKPHIAALRGGEKKLPPTSSACLIVRRTIFEEIEKKSQIYPRAIEWWDPTLDLPMYKELELSIKLLGYSVLDSPHLSFDYEHSDDDGRREISLVRAEASRDAQLIWYDFQLATKTLTPLSRIKALLARMRPLSKATAAHLKSLLKPAKSRIATRLSLEYEFFYMTEPARRLIGETSRYLINNKSKPMLSDRQRKRPKHGNNTIYLTIDDSPSERMAEKLNLLKQKQIPAVWFCQGNLLERHPDLGLEAIKAGHLLANHSFSHRRFSSLNATLAYQEIRRTDLILDNLYKQSGLPWTRKLFRFPYGDTGGWRSPIFRRILDSLGYEIISWTFDFEEYLRDSLWQARFQDFTPHADEILLIHDHAKTTHHFTAIIEQLSKKSWNFRLLGEERSIQSLFVVGCEHSGTSLAIRLLGQHSQIYPIPGESYLFHQDENTIRVALKNFDCRTIQAKKSAWVEKTPSHVNYCHKILRYRPNARFIGMTRDPVDVAISLKSRGIKLSSGINMWLSTNRAMLDFKECHPQSMMILRLEDLVKDPKQMIDKMLNFLNFEREPLTEFHQRPVDWYSSESPRKPASVRSETNHNRLRNWQLNQPIFSTTKRCTAELSEEDLHTFRASADRISCISNRISKLIASPL